MKRSKSMEALGGRRWRFSHALLTAVAVYFVFISLKFCHFPESGTVRSGDRRFSGGGSGGATGDVGRHFLGSIYHGDAFYRRHDPSQMPPNDPLALHASTLQPYRQRYGRITGEMLRRFERSRNQNRTRSGNFSELEKMAHEAWLLGLKAWEEVKSYKAEEQLNSTTVLEGKPKSCPSFVLMNGVKGGAGGEPIMLLPCGLAVGSSVTVIGTPQITHDESVPKLERLRQGNGKAMVSQFVVELQGLKTVDGEDPPKILHLNPRLKGDWSKRPVIEHNTCYRMQWGKAMRCDGRPSEGSNETVDGFKSCEKWEHAETVDLGESKTTSWLNRFIGRAKKPEMAWPFPFVEGRMFVLTLQAGVEGFHINVGGRHVTSFPHRSGFTLEDATGLAIKENVDIHSVYATSLPESHPSFSLHDVLEMSEKWKTPPLPENPVEVFIGVLSGTNHFAERMAIRKTWMQYPAIQSSNVVARFFVALGPRKDVNAALKKESEYFGDIVILPFMDRYELVVLKTIAICEFGVHNLTAEYIMKSDDDTFTRVDVILKEIEGIARNKSLFMGNLNFFHSPLRSGKWAVTYQEWPEEVYPTYANGPGYIISSDIAKYIASQHANQTLRLFKMEDVSMGMWVEEFNATTPVQYSHSWNFCQYGCMENYYTAHYQSPRQMMCLWENLSRGQPQCCNFR